MDLLFAVTAQPAPQDPTIIDTNIVDHYPTLNANTSWQVFKPFVRQATQKKLMPYLGRTLYNVIIASGDNTYDDVIEQLRDALAHYSVAIALPKLLTVIGEAGVGQNVSEKFQNTNQWSYKNTLWDATQQADSFLDVALAQLSEINTPEVEAWKNSKHYQRHRPNWLSTLEAFERYHSLMGSRRTYIALVPYIEKAIDRFLMPVLGDTLEIRLRQNEPATSLISEVTRRIERMLAAYAIYMAVPNLMMVIEGDGFKTISQLDGYDQRTNIVSTSGKEAVVGLRSDAERTAKKARADLTSFLLKHKEELPEFLASPSYAEQTSRNILTSGGAVFL